jgi:hypothetical protein
MAGKAGGIRREAHVAVDVGEGSDEGRHVRAHVGWGQLAHRHHRLQPSARPARLRLIFGGLRRGC